MINAKNKIEFCIADNIAHYLGYKQNKEAIGFLFLTMDVLGFKYNGIRGSCYEILNGLNGDSREFINRCFDFYTFEKEVINTTDILKSKIENIMLEIDDYYLESSPFFQKYHHLRYVNLLKNETNECEIYDMGLISVERKNLKRIAVSGCLVKNKENFNVNVNIANMISDKIIISEQKPSIINSLLIFKDELLNVIQGLQSDDFYNLFFFTNKVGGPAQIRNSSYIALNMLFKYITKNKEKIQMKIDVLNRLKSEWIVLGNTFFRMSKLMNSNIVVRIINQLDVIIELEKQFQLL